MVAIKYLHGDSIHEFSSSRFVVGRSELCSLKLDNALVSAEHAAFHWTGSEWQLRDLGSSNGTFVGTYRLLPGHAVIVVPGSQIAFGDQAERFELIDDAPPLATARAEDGELVSAERCGCSSILFLPDLEHPELTIYEDGPGHWLVLGHDHEPRAIDTDEWICCAGQRWQLTLPLILDRTARPPVCLAQLQLRFAVSQYGDLLQAALRHRGSTIPLQLRQHSKLLLILAEARLTDSSNPRLHESEHGWMHIDDLVQDLFAGKSERMHSAKHRARKQFCQLEVADWMELFEHRPLTREIRLAIADLEIVRL